MSNFKRQLLIIIILVFSSSLLSAESGLQGIIYPDQYRFRSGDSLIWANPDLDDNGWQLFARGSFPDKEWQGIGWFRFELRIDTALTGIPLGLVIDQIGATQLYVDGLLKYQMGKAARTRGEEVPYMTDWHPAPSVIVFSGKTPDDDLTLMVLKF